MSTLFCAGLLAGCGDNIMKSSTAGTGGSDGSVPDANGGSAGGGGVGGTAGVGGVGGSAGMGGMGGMGGAAVTCPDVAFVTPLDKAVLTAADDASAMSCATGFKYNVKVSVTADDGTVVELHGAVVPGSVASPPLLATAMVTNNAVTFTNVQLSEGNTTLTVEIGGVKCTPAVTVTVDCKLPTCAISLPTHDLLNGVAAPAGDRASSAGSDYQAAFTVTTDIEDGQPVVLTVTSVAAPTATPVKVTANAMSGKAVFAGVTLKPDGQYGVVATCTNKATVVGTSMKVTYTVDTTPPVLTVDQPLDGAVIGPAGLTAGAFKVCGTTTSADAVNLPASAGAAASNLCVTRGQSTTCVPVTALSTSTCVNVACPGGAPFDLTVKLFDAAGNPTSDTVTGISCASTLPSVEIIAPLTDSPNFTDVSKRLLSSTSTQTLKDADGVTAGAQTTVVACTDTMGASAKLFVGHKGDATLTALGTAVTVVAAVTADNCPNGKGFVAKFTGVTLPESTETATGTLTAATEIRVDVADATNPAAVGTSGPTDLWVDSVNPTLTEKTPTPLCGSTQVAPVNTTIFTTDVALNSTTDVVTFRVTNGVTLNYGPPTYVAGTPGTATFTSVDFPQGENTIDSVATDPAGNTASLTPPVPMLTCKLTVGTAPVVTFTSPAAGINLCANGNTAATCIADSTPGAGSAAGWQGNVTVHVTSGGVALTTGNVTFTIAGGAPQTAALNATGDATLTGITIADGAAVVLTATTDNVVGHGIGTASETVLVDTLAPAGATAVTATVLDRRQTSFTLGWIAPDDNGKAVADYDIHVKVRNPTSGDPCGTEISSVPFSGTPVATGSMQSIAVPNLFIETDYCFTVAARDTVGNVGPVANSSGRADFQTTILSGTGTENAGFAIDGTSDFGSPGSFTNDGRSDLILGGALGRNVYVFFGRATGYPPAPDITITGPVNRFGTGAIAAGDIDGDGLTDIAIGSRDEVPAKVYIFSRKNPPASWGTTTSWPAALTAAQANYVITGDATYNATRFGFSLGRLGNFDGTGADDLAIGAMLYDGSAMDAGRVVVVKGSPTFSSITLPDATNTIVIDGESASDYFGYGIEAVPGNTLVVSAYGAAPNSGGKVYAFRGLAGSAISASAADDSTFYSPAGSQYGFVVGSMGALGASPAAVTITSNVTPAFVDLHMAPLASGPFGGTKGSIPVPSVRFTSSLTANSFGVINIGGVASGSFSIGSIIGGENSHGDNLPDLVLAGQNAANGAIYIVSGAAIPGLPVAVDLGTTTIPGIVTIKNKLPTGWVGFGRGTLVLDSNGDGYADFAFGEFATGTPGRAVVFW